MNAPEKLVFNEALFSDIGIFGVEEEVEYIRKDWINNELSSALENANDVFDAVRRIGVLIDKVNEL